ncbi:MAG: SDR family oxidoreductase [Desulfurococcales archaeon]|nr:SDR family oxidoreductase [Desulfurococcales archaeon]
MTASRRALVTGASRGIGYAIAEALARRGYELVISARGVEGLRRAAESLRSAGASRVVVAPGDLRVREDVVRVVSSAIDALGGLEAVVMSYGNPTCEPCTLTEAGWEDWLEASSLYLASTATVLRLLVERNPVKASVILVSSATYLEPMAPLVVADVTRAGLVKLARLASRSYPEKLRVNVLLLGSYDTPGARATIEKLARRRGVDPEEVWRREVVGRSPLGRAGDPRELGELAASIIESTDYLSGAAILVDGLMTPCSP